MAKQRALIFHNGNRYNIFGIAKRAPIPVMHNPAWVRAELMIAVEKPLLASHWGTRLPWQPAIEVHKTATAWFPITLHQCKTTVSSGFKQIMVHTVHTPPLLPCLLFLLLALLLHMPSGQSFELLLRLTAKRRARHKTWTRCKKASNSRKCHRSDIASRICFYQEKDLNKDGDARLETSSNSGQDGLAGLYQSLKCSCGLITESRISNTSLLFHKTWLAPAHKKFDTCSYLLFVSLAWIEWGVRLD